MAEAVEPQVFLIATTSLNTVMLEEYLAVIGAPDWQTDAATDSEALIEVGGRLCYNSFEPGLNKNVTRVREGNKPYMRNIIESSHGSVLEHATCTFIFHHVSRVFTAELCRHRAGCAVSEASLRFIRLDQLKAFMSEEFEVAGTAEYFLEKLAELEQWQQEMAQQFDLDHGSFDVKKRLTSAMRRLAPMGVATSIMWTANFRALRHVLQLRTSRHAEEEIRLVFDRVGEMLTAKYPAVFGDFSRNEHGEWVTPYSKV